MFSRLRWIPIAAGLLVVVAGCAAGGTREADTGGGRLRIVTTVSPITNIVANIAGGHAEVTGVVPMGADSHEFDPPPSVARILAEADVVFLNGLDLEVPTLRMAEANLGADAEVVLLGEATISQDRWIFDFSFPEEEGDPNPHLWMNPLHGKMYAEVVADTLARIDPDNTDEYAANLAAFSAKVDELDTALRRATETVPHRHRKLLTYHDSFPYFAREYGWEVIGAIQPSDFSDPTPREVAEMITQIRESGVPAIFGSEVFASPVLEQIARETPATYLADLRDDELIGEPGSPGRTYLGMLAFDYITIVEALGGDASAIRAVDTSNVAEDTAAYL